MKSAKRRDRTPGDKSLSRLRLARIVALTVTVAAFCGYLDHFTQTFSYLEQQSYGDRLKLAAELNPSLMDRARAQIAVVTLSDASFDPANPERLPGPPLPRPYYAKLIRALTRDGAKVIAFDIAFDTPRHGDAEFADAVRRSGRVLLACAEAATGGPKIVPPEPLLRRAAAGLGHTRVPLDPELRAVDRVEPVIMEPGRLIPAFSVQAARMASGAASQPPRRYGGGWQFGGLKIPVEADGTFMIRYLDAPGRTFGPIPLEDVTSHEALYHDSPIFRDKIVVVGYTLTTPDSRDVHNTPVGEMPGVEIQAHAIATLLAGRFVHDAPPAAEVAALVGLASLASLLASVWRLKRAALFLVLLLPAYFVLNMLLFLKEDVSLHLMAPSAAILMTALGVLLERGLTEEQEKTRVRGLLQRYVSPQIAAYVLQHPELMGRAGTRATGTVLFSDIRGFTALSEQLPPEELVSRMNEYFETMIDIVFRHEGTAASIVGDAMLALFGVPVPHPNHARRAVAAAIEMQGALTELQERWRAQDQRVFDIGIGINTGEMVVGDVGGRHLTSFTVYGLQVNIASRVEGLNKDLGSCILITRATYESVAGDLDVRGPLRVPIKGVEEPIEVYEVLGWRGAAGERGQAHSSRTTA
ncbi:MAG: adenylate/guanylate cyclase domain-containing protein [Armatimonadetes bacterium]|nr:adenylate/guanylate cyclase domain-containing protein [Armatimonadota bacterium]